MKTLKFRAWCFTDKKFYDRVCVGNTSTDDPCSIVWVSDERGWVNFDKLNGVFQQFTGLLDKNGKEIYEGDIITGKFDLGLAGWVDHKWTVQWHNELGYQWDYWNLATIEVVGNIFERRLQEQTRLAERLKGREKPNLDEVDFGTPHWREE